MAQGALTDLKWVKWCLHSRPTESCFARTRRNVLVFVQRLRDGISIEQLEAIATQRLAISRVRLNEANCINRESLDVPPSAKIGPIKHVGCMAVLGRTGLNAMNERRTIRERAIEKGVRRL